MDSEKSNKIKPRIIIHGGAGNITRENLPPKAYAEYRDALKSIVNLAYSQLRQPGATALDVATYAVSLLEDNPLFNSGHGAVYTTAGTHELEASVMVSRGYRKRGVGIMNVTRAKNPIKVAREMLIRGEEDGGGGAQGHCQLQGKVIDELAEKWGLEIVKPSYFWTRRRWDEHRRGLGKKYDDETYARHRRRADEEVDDCDPSYATHPGVSEQIDSRDPSWNGKEYLPQGTVGAVVMDSTGTLCCATSTGGLTNKLPGRIGDTPTLGAGFWAEEWTTDHEAPANSFGLTEVASYLPSVLNDCLPSLSGYTSLSSLDRKSRKIQSRRAVAMSGTGNGDSFLRVSAVRTAAAMARFQLRPSSTRSNARSETSLQEAVSAVAGPNGVLQQSAEDRWHKTGEGEGGIIGIEMVDGHGKVVFDYNCGGMFHAWVDDDGRTRFQVFKDQLDL